jgi:hypothetical protein
LELAGDLSIQAVPEQRFDALGAVDVGHWLGGLFIEDRPPSNEFLDPNVQPPFQLCPVARFPYFRGMAWRTGPLSMQQGGCD